MQPPVRSEFVTTDPEEGRARVEEMYADSSLTVRGSTEDFRFEQTRWDLGPVRLDTFGNTLQTDYSIDPLEQVLIVRMVDGAMGIDTDATHRVFGRGDIALLAQPDLGYASYLDHARMQLVGFDLDYLDSVDGSTEDVRRLRYDTLAPEQARQWTQTHDYVLRTVADPVASASPLMMGAAARMLAASTLAAFHPAAQLSTDAAAGTGDRIDATPATLRRAVAYLEANPDLDLGVAEVAASCHVSVRALQLAFRRHLDTTPMAYLRRVRLARVHDELLAADPDGDVTVTEVAARWGLLGSGRFTARYRDEYGEVPSATLRRG